MEPRNSQRLKAKLCRFFHNAWKYWCKVVSFVKYTNLIEFHTWLVYDFMSIQLPTSSRSAKSFYLLRQRRKLHQNSKMYYTLDMLYDLVWETAVKAYHHVYTCFLVSSSVSKCYTYLVFVSCMYKNTPCSYCTQKTIMFAFICEYTQLNLGSL